MLKILNQKKILLSLFILVLFFCTCQEKDNDTPRRLIILYTNDEHGWMEPTETHGGAAGLMGLWREKEGYKEDGHYLILTQGDELLLTFENGRAVSDAREVWVVARGYYVPLR